MTDNKKISPDDKKSLKHADIDKFGSNQISADSLDKGDFLIGERKEKSKQNKSSSGIKRSVPLALDIIIAVAIVLVVAALIVGAYFIFKNYADSYKDVNIKYTLLICDSDGATDTEALKGKEIYLDLDGNTYYFGKITNTALLKGADGTVQITVEASVSSKYRRGEGYSIDGNRIAVGSEYSLRLGEDGFDATVVEISRGGGN